MILDRIKDFQRRPYEAKAIELLQDVGQYPGLQPWKEHDVRFRLIRLPSYEAYSVWALHQSDGIYRVRRLEWDRLLDAQKPASAPTLFGADAELPRKSVQQLLIELSLIALPPFLPVSTIGLDGISHAVEFGDCWRSASLAWWGKPPRQWRALAEWYGQAVKLFEQFLPVSEARHPELSRGI